MNKLFYGIIGIAVFGWLIIVFILLWKLFYYLIGYNLCR